MSKNVDDLDLVFFDLETTGGNPQNSGITEIAAIKYSRGKEIGRFHTLVNPMRPIPNNVRKMTGIDNSMVKDAPSMPDIIDDFLDFLGNGILVSHGALCDVAYIAYYARKCSGTELKNYYLCTHLLVCNFIPTIPSKSLSGVATYFGIQAPEAHRAVADAETTAAIFWKIHEIFDRGGHKTLEDLLKVQADNETLRRLGSGLLGKDIEKVPTTPGLFYLYNSIREIVYMAAAPNLRQGLTAATDLGEEKEFNRLIVDVSGFEFERSPHFLAALLKEKRELKKRTLPIDPRKFERRTAGFIQILLPEDMLAFARENPDSVPFPVPREDDEGLDWLEDDSFNDTAEPHPAKHFRDRGFVPADIALETSTPLAKAEDSAMGGYALQWQQSPGSKDAVAVPVRSARRTVLGTATEKFRLTRENNSRDIISLGHLAEGVGWWFGPFEHPKTVRRLFEELEHHLPFSDPDLPMETRLLNLQFSILALYGRLDKEIEALEEERDAIKNVLRPIYRRRLGELIDRLRRLNGERYSIGKQYLPRTGIAVISNNDFKELDVVIAVGGRVKKESRLSFENSDKLQSPRFLTRLFHAYHNELRLSLAPMVFTDDVCSDLELFAHWIQNRRGEGDWADFEDLEPLYDISLI